MKTWKLLPQNNFFQALRKKGARGQSIVEFVLLLLVITGLSFSFVAVMNGNLARYWEYSANLVINDKPGGPKAVSLR